MFDRVVSEYDVILSRASCPDIVDSLRSFLSEKDLSKVISDLERSEQGRIQGSGPPIFVKVNFIFYIVYNV